jgi:hypothetical protein
MSVAVYWSLLSDEWMRATPPSPVRKSLYEKKLHEESELMMFHKCPFLHEHLSETYALHSPYEYSFKIENGLVSSDLYNQDFFNDRVSIRSIEKKCFSFNMPYVFFTEEKSLELSIPSFPYLENNNISQRCSPFVGTIDIGKYFRPIDFAFFLKDPYNEFIIEKDEIFGYASFKTKEKIVLKQFYPTEKIKAYFKDVKNVNKNKTFFYQGTESFYEKFRLKKIILKEIKENLLD